MVISRFQPEAIKCTEAPKHATASLMQRQGNIVSECYVVQRCSCNPPSIALTSVTQATSQAHIPCAFLGNRGLLVVVYEETIFLIQIVCPLSASEFLVVQQGDLQPTNSAGEQFSGECASIFAVV